MAAMEAKPNRPTDSEIIRGIALQFDCPEAVALSWLTLMFVHFDPRAMAERLAGYDAAPCRTSVQF